MKNIVLFDFLVQIIQTISSLIISGHFRVRYQKFKNFLGFEYQRPRVGINFYMNKSITSIPKKFGIFICDEEENNCRKYGADLNFISRTQEDFLFLDFEQ